MSRSPTPQSSADEVLSYDAAWSALNKLVRSGSSFSGRERHCAFLNLGAQGFANVSFVSNLDLIDDGRGLATCDWDWDGRVDFWTTSRTGPRVRFLHNRFESDNGFLALRLRGSKSNRDAIGARVEVRPGQALVPLVRTRHGGSGFLSQSSGWLHFGIPADQLDQELEVTVHWPGGEREVVSGLRPNAFYRLVEGSGQAQPFTPPATRADLGAERVASAASSGKARVVVLNPAPMPAIRYTDTTGREASLDDLRGKPVLLHLWASWCANCRKEMTQWAAQKKALSPSGISLLSLCVDEPGGEGIQDLAGLLETVKEWNYPYAVGRVGGDSLQALNVVQKSFIGKQRDLPLPSSFLIDAKGRLAVIYKGPVPMEQVLKDKSLLDAGPGGILAGAVPFPGRWLEHPRGGPARGIALKLLDHGMSEACEEYLQRLVAVLEKEAPASGTAEEETRSSELSECRIFLGALAFDEKRFEDAVRHLRAAIRIAPEKSRARDELVRALLKLNREAEALEELAALNERDATPERLLLSARIHRGLERFDQAVSLFERVLSMRATAEVAFELANLQRDRRKADDAVRYYRQALELRPGWALPANNLAWILGTHGDETLRDGEEAVRLATMAFEATGRRIPQFAGTLAAAHAEAGAFDQAVAAARQSIDLAKAQGKQELALRLEARLALYREGKKVREPAN